MTLSLRSAILIALTATAPAIAAGDPPAKHDIVDTAIQAGAFTTLVDALESAKLVDALKGKGPYTVFAPTDEAFARLEQEVSDADTLRSILKYHVVSGSLTAKDVVKLRSAETLNGQRISIDVRGSNVRLDRARLVKTDIECSNGVIHVIDAVLMPATDNIVEVASKAGAFGTLLKAATAAGLAKPLMGDGPFTVLAPTDDAFAKIDDKTLRSLLRKQNRDKLAAILKYHVIPGRVYADQALQARTASTLQKANVDFAIRSGRLTVNDAVVLDNDIQASNGVIHVIDTVLMPPRPRGAKFFGLSFDRPSGALAAQLGLDRNKTLVVSSVTKGSNAQSAGLRRYDVITKVGGRPASDKNISRAKREGDYGDPVRFEIIRGGERQPLDIRIGERKH